MARNRSGASSRRLVSTPLAMLKTASVTEDCGREQVGAGDVVDEDEVHRLGAVAEDQRRLARVDPLHPADEHLGVHAVDVHPRAVHVEVAQRDVVEAVHVVEAAQQALVEDLRRAVERPVGVRVVRPRSVGNSFREPVDRRATTRRPLRDRRLRPPPRAR